MQPLIAVVVNPSNWLSDTRHLGSNRDVDATGHVRLVIELDFDLDHCPDELGGKVPPTEGVGEGLIQAARMAAVRSSSGLAPSAPSKRLA